MSPSKLSKSRLLVIFGVFIIFAIIILPQTGIGDYVGKLAFRSADLVVSDVSVTPVNPTMTDPIMLKITLKNEGNKSAARFFLSAQDQNSDWGTEQMIKSLAKNSTTVIYLPLPPIDTTELLKNNPHTFEVIVDAKNRIKEKKELNNFRLTSFFVAGPANQTPLDMVAIESLPQNPDLTINPDLKNVEMLRFKIKSQVSGTAVNIKSLTLTSSGQPYIDSLGLFDEQGIGFKWDSPRFDQGFITATLQFPDNLLIAPGQSQLLVAKASFNKNAPHNMLYRLSLKQISASLNLNQSRQQLINVDYAGRAVTIDNPRSAFAILNMTQASDTIVNPGAKDVEIIRFQLQARNYSFAVNNFVVSLPGKTSYFSRLGFYDDQDRLVVNAALQNINNGVEGVFMPRTIVIPAGNILFFRIKADFSQTAPSGFYGTQLKNLTAIRSDNQGTYVYTPNYNGRNLTILALQANLPDVAPINIFFTDKAVLQVSFKNLGPGSVPQGQGSLVVTVDGQPLTGYSFSSLSDQSFRNPGGNAAVSTGLRLAGANRVISFMVDNVNQIIETNENNNLMVLTLTPPAQIGPDFIIDNLSKTTDGYLTIWLKNSGNSVSKSVNIRQTVIVNESTVGNYSMTLPELAVGGIYAFTPVTPWVRVNNGDQVRVLLNTNNIYDEIDNTNNKREQTM